MWKILVAPRLWALLLLPSLVLLMFTFTCANGLPASTATATTTSVESDEYDDMHPQLGFNTFRGSSNNPDNSGKRVKRGPLPLKFLPPNMERYGNYWTNEGQSILQKQLHKNRLNKREAKNVILFIGDGMSIPTLTATRVYMGGENMALSFEEFPFTGLSKTYCANTQVADSACSATAYLTGVKANYATLGVTAAVELGDCMAENNTANHVDSIMAWAQAEKMSTGFVTTTEVTNASPAGVYAHSANRNWENDQILIRDGADPEYCTDIAKQLIYGEVGRRLNVIMGGGRQQFLSNTSTDGEGAPGKRGDNINLLDEWQRLHNKSGGVFVDTKDKLAAVDPLLHNHVLGLFSAGHMPFHLEREANLNRPTLEEMMSKALDVLEQNENGYVLFVEGGRIDHGHHKTQAQRALDETVELHRAVKTARQRTNEEDTLIVVTSDHSHTMAMSGYSSRGNNILGINNAQNGLDRLPYATLSYANGPGFTQLFDESGARRNLQELDMDTQTFMFPSTIPLKEETHGGDDVAVFASGPWAHLFSGTFEQNLIPHAIGYATCIGKGLTACAEN